LICDSLTPTRRGPLVVSGDDFSQRAIHSEVSSCNGTNRDGFCMHNDGFRSVCGCVYVCVNLTIFFGNIFVPSMTKTWQNLPLWAPSFVNLV